MPDLHADAVALIAEFQAEGNTAAAEALADALDDPERLQELLGESDVQESVAATGDPVVDDSDDDPLHHVLLETGFTGTITTKDGRKRTYQDGKEVKGQGQQTGSQQQAKQHPVDAKPPSVDEALAGLDKHPEIKKKPGLLGKIKKAAQTAVSTAARLAYDAALHSPQLLGIMGTVFQEPEDFKKIGFTPVGAGEQHQAADALKEHLGISTHLAANLVAKIGGAAIAHAKKLLGKQRSESYSDVDLQTLAEFMHQFFTAIAGELGLGGVPSVEELAERLPEILTESQS